MSGKEIRFIFVNANLITLDPHQPRASTMAIRGDRIEAIGDDREILKLKTERTQVIDLGGKTVSPGFIDCHLHLYWYGQQLLREADLVGSRDLEDLLARLS